MGLANGFQPAQAEVVRDDEPQIEGLSGINCYEWRDPQVKPQAVAIAVHGLVLHGGVYDVMARDLASKGFIVVAPDLRGYGRWAQEHHKTHELTNDGKAIVRSESKVLEVNQPSHAVNVCDLKKPQHSMRVSYDKSYRDVRELVKAVRNAYPSMPLFIIGESLGAGIALHAAADMPDSVNGIVLSSPAIKRRLYIEPRMVVDVMTCMANPTREVDLIPYIKRFASEDQQVIESAIEDPLVRKKLTIVDLLKTAQLIKGNLHHADRIPVDMPVLIIQGDQDRMLKSNGVVTLLGHLKSHDQTVKWFAGKGHLLLETPHVMPETLDTVSSWLIEHSIRANLVKASNP